LQGERIKGVRLLTKIIDNGVVVYSQPSLSTIRDNAIQNLARLPVDVVRLKKPRSYSVEISPGLKKLTSRVSRDILRKTKQ